MRTGEKHDWSGTRDVAGMSDDELVSRIRDALYYPYGNEVAEEELDEIARRLHRSDAWDPVGHDPRDGNV